MASSFSEVFDPTKTLENYKQDIINDLIEIDPTITTDLAEGTPLMNIISVVALRVADIMELSMAMYADQSPDTASFQALINKYSALYGVEYQGGKQTQQPIVVEVISPCVIHSDSGNGYTQFQISDSNGNIYYPASDHTFTTAGVYTITFLSADYDSIRSDVGDITNILTTTQGIKSVNNTSTYTLLGESMESVTSFRKRLLSASRFYKTQGNTATIISLLKNAGCSDALIVRNFSAFTENEIPSGSVAIITKDADTTEMRESIANVISKNFTSAYLYGFDAPIDPNYGRDWNVTSRNNMNNQVGYFHLCNNGVLTITINGVGQTKRGLDFSSCNSATDILTVFQNAGFTNCTFGFVSTTDKRIRCYCTQNEKRIDFVNTPLETGEWDINGANYLGSGTQDFTWRTTTSIKRIYEYAGDRYSTTITWSEALSMPIEIKFTWMGETPLTTDQKTQMASLIAEKFVENGYIAINQSVNTTQLMVILQEIILNWSLVGFIDGARFKPVAWNEEWWDTSYIPDHIYYIPSISSSNITIKNYGE